MSHSMFHAAFPSAFLCFKEVIKLRFCTQIFLEPKDPLAIDDVPNLAVGIEKIPKFPRPCGTGFHTGWISSGPHPLDTKGAFVHGTFHSGSISKVVDGRVYLLFGNVRLCPVENPSFVRAGCNAVSASNTPVVIHHDDPIRFLPGGVDRTYLHAGRLLTLLALNREIDESLLGNQFRVIVMFRVFEIDQVSSLEPENPDPLELRIMARMVVFLHTGIDASSAANTSGKFQAVSPEGIGKSFLRADLKFPSIFLLISLFQLCNDTLLFFLCHFAEMFLQEVLNFLLGAGGEERKRKACQGGE
jgi:hypothetical protein